MTTFDLKRNSGLPALGTHTFKVTRAMERDGENYPYWLLFCKVIDKSEDREKQASILLSHSPDARFRVDGFLDAINAPEDGNIKLEEVIGKVFRGTVSHDTYEGNLRAKIEQTMPYTASTAQLPMDEVQGMPEDVVPEESDLPF
ncbi:hypothetical protein LCGC14_0466420 [marine sediment metagenome]|uniref:DUF669 domain-containing protein n=1 Tax=marine sediment metagenome TaxID=412755 RepID=A0A0F9SWH7_9ZZZZ